jgi:glyoxylase-like metal-dependent hydrolase (beta-lactamase superfamily II)
VAPEPIVIPLPIPFSARVVNCYLFEGEPLTLVDPGADWEETEIELEAGLRMRGLRVEDVEQIVLTHQHLDHVGLAHRVKERSGARVVAHHLLRDFLADLPESMRQEDDYQAEVMRFHGVPEERIRELYRVSEVHRRYGGSVQVDRALDEGDAVELGGRRMIALFRSGHSPTDTIFVDERVGLAIVGDHLIGHISSNPVVHRPLDRPADVRDRRRSLVAYIDSMRATAALGLRVMLPGHGNVLEDRLAELVAERLEFHERRKERIYGALADEPRTVYEIAVALWGSVAEREAFLTMSETVGHLDLLENEGRVRWTERDGVAVYERV